MTLFSKSYDGKNIAIFPGIELDISEQNFEIFLYIASFLFVNLVVTVGTIKFNLFFLGNGLVNSVVTVLFLSKPRISKYICDGDKVPDMKIRECAFSCETNNDGSRHL